MRSKHKPTFHDSRVCQYPTPHIHNNIHAHTNRHTHTQTNTHTQIQPNTPCKQQNSFDVTLKIQTKIRISRIYRKSFRIDNHAFEIEAQLPTLAQASHRHTHTHKRTNTPGNIGR